MDVEIARSRLAVAVRNAVLEASARQMQWGVDDCALFFADIIRDALGYDPAADLRGTYDTAEGAARALGKLWLCFHSHAFARKWGWHRVDPSEALPGDVGFMRFPISETQRRITVMVCRAPGWFCGRSERGVVTVQYKAVRLVSAVV